MMPPPSLNIDGLDLTGRWLLMDASTMGRYYEPVQRRVVYCYKDTGYALHVRFRSARNASDSQFGRCQIERLATQAEIQ